MLPPLLLLVSICFLCALLAVLTKKLTVAGGIAAFVIAMLMGAAWAWNGLALLGSFFLLAVMATRKGKVANRENSHQEKRDVWQVLANGGVAALCTIPVIMNPHWTSRSLLIAGGALSAATADTLSSELGTIWGKRFVNILTWKADQKGLDGVVSLEGTLAGMGGSTVIGLVACWYLPFVYIPAIVLAGLGGNLVDSILGAALERKHRIGNNMVNLVNTLTGALLMVFVLWLDGRYRIFSFYFSLS